MAAMGTVWILALPTTTPLFFNGIEGKGGVGTVFTLVVCWRRRKHLLPYKDVGRRDAPPDALSNLQQSWYITFFLAASPVLKNPTFPTNTT
ncbi:MAG: hypothetical protein ACR2I2_06825 [Bryobacteraceae bacterium]